MGAGEGIETLQSGARATGTFAVKAGLARMLKGGVIMDVINVEQARIAEEAGIHRRMGFKLLCSGGVILPRVLACHVTPFFRVMTGSGRRVRCDGA